MKKVSEGESKRIKIVSDYLGFDFFLIKQPVQCALKIPQTIMLDRYGAPKQWIFNSSRGNGVILKKRKENLLPLSILKSICAKYLPASLLSPIKTISELINMAKEALKQQKYAQFTSRKRHVEIRTVDGQLQQMGLTQFLDIIGSNNLAEQSFYEKWRMIQQRVSIRKNDESYLVESQRKNHLIESKCSKHIELAPAESTSYIETIPSTQLIQPEVKSEDYKFFDSYLNKKFFTAVQQLVECIEKNYKCIVENITTRFVIDYNRQPYITEVQQVYVKPSRRLYEIREFSHSISSGEIKFQNYCKCLLQYLFQNPTRIEPTLDRPLHQFRKHKCKGQFCNVTVLSIPHLTEPRLKLPIIGSNIRRMPLSLIEATKKKKGRVLERFKQKAVIPIDYLPEESESSQFDDSELEQTQQNVRVCETCFAFYLNIMKFFEIDSYGGIIQRKAPVVNSAEKKREQMGTLDLNLKKKDKAVDSLKRSASQATKLRPIPYTSRSKPNSANRSMSTPTLQKSKLRELYKKVQRIKPSEPKKNNPLLASELASVAQQTTNKMIQLKLSNVKVSPGDILKPQVKSPKKGMDCKPTNFLQASEQLLSKLQFVPRSSRQQFIIFCKKYYRDKLPQKVDRIAFSSEYLPHLYEFMNNSPLVLAPANLIHGRPEMSLKRLSALTGYPEIVSRSAFIFDTIICDQKTTVPFCVIGSEMVHGNNNSKRPYHNIFLVNDIFDSFIEFIATAKQLLEQMSNCRIILFNYPGQSHTIYDANSPFRPAQFNAIVDKIIYKLSQPGKGYVIGPADRFKFIGLGLGGFFVSCLLSATFALHSLTDGVLLVNAGSNCSTKCREIYSTLLGLFQAEDKPTINNAFLIYNKSIRSPQMSRDELQNKGGLNPIRLEGRVYLLRNALRYWQQYANQFFVDYQGQVSLLHGGSDILVSKSDMEELLHRRNAEGTVIANRSMAQVNGRHELAVQNYDQFVKSVSKLIG